ncbi:hypothetical protein Tco_0172411 [Tanacetum coccineum]
MLQLLNHSGKQSNQEDAEKFPPPITGNFLTLRADISFASKTNEANTQKPKTFYESVNIDKVIIEDWNSDDENDMSEVQTVSPVKTDETQTVKTIVDKIDQTYQKQGIGFKKIKACFVCKRVLTRTGLITPVKKNEKRAVHKVSTARPVSTAKPAGLEGLSELLVVMYSKDSGSFIAQEGAIQDLCLHESCSGGIPLFKLEAFSDSDYGGASLDRKSTTGGCQFLGPSISKFDFILSEIARKKKTDKSYQDSHRAKDLQTFLTKGFDVTRFNFLVLKNVHVPLDHFSVNALTSKVFSFMVKKGKHFSGNVTPLFESMLVQLTEDEGDASERQSEPQPTPSPPHPSTDQHETQPDPSPRPSPTIPIPASISEGSGGNHGGQSSSDRSLSGNEDGLTIQSVYDICVSLCKHVTTQAAQIKDLKYQIKQLKKKAKPVITYHKAWMKSGSKSAKSTPTAHTDQVFDDVDVNDAMDYMETDAYMQKGVSTKDQVSTVKPDKGTDKPKVSTDKPEVSTAKPKEVEVSTDKLNEGTAEPKDGTSDESTAPTTVFRDDETIAEFLWYN